MRLCYGVVQKVNGGRCCVELFGFDGPCSIDEALLLQPCGQSGAKTWLPPSEGDTVAVLLDPERPEDCLAIGGVYGDKQAPPVGKNGEIALLAQKLSLGRQMDQLSAAARDDLVQTELAKIRAALESLRAAYNAHTHALTAIPVMSAGAVIGAATGVTGSTIAQATTGYDVDTTASKSVFID